MDYEKADLVWFDPGLGYVLPGEVIEFHKAGQVITVQAVIGGKSQTFTLTNLSSVRRRQDLGENGFQDMISLNDLNEASILWNLKIRYDNQNIYTYTGSILVSLNPYRMFDIYGLDVVKQYEGQILGTLPPHVFAIGSSAYSRMTKDAKSQCVVISGESGSGKTESTKLLMQYLAAVNKCQSNLITEQILEASPLLESFGNAKSIKNDNSSRFGKYLEVYFKEGIITGAKITEYLLEKSRIITHAQEERNYHVFYEMLAGLSKEKKSKYGLSGANKYFYLNQGGNCKLSCKDDADDFQTLLSAMQVLGFTPEEQDTIFRVLATVLHLGNVYFHRKQLRHGQEGVEIGSEAEIKWVAHLLQLDIEGLKLALTTKITDLCPVTVPKGMEARHDRVATPLTIDQALDARDAVAKALYSALFSWLVTRINLIIHKGTKKSSISILDIFGFEIFKENSFEQLCINYANEKMHFYFNKHIFKMEQQEYAKERIEWEPMEFQDNATVIDLIARKPVGILHLLDDESNFPKSTDSSFQEKCHYNHALNELYSRPRMPSLEFGIKHFAGQVWYNVDGFLDKNRDTLRTDVIDLLISSKLPMLSVMFIDVRLGSENKTLTKANGRFVTMKPRTPTVAARFNDSLASLIESMTESNPWFIRCIKPNNEKAAMKFDMPLVLEQLRYSGMLDTIKIRKQGYPIRLKFSHFAQRYRCLFPGPIPRGAPSKEICRVVLDRSGMHSSRGNYTVGLSKVFLREFLEKELEEKRYKKLSHAVITIQRHARGMIARKRYRSYKRAAICVQSVVRMWQAQKRYNTIRKGVIKAQAAARGRSTRKQFKRLQEEYGRRKHAEVLAKQRSIKKETVVVSEDRPVAAVSHLEIPAELAFTLSKNSEWPGPYKNQGFIGRSTGAFRQDRTVYRLPHDIDYHAFTKFTNIYFKSHLWGMKREPIKTPFLPKNRDAEYADSLSIFKLLLRFMNDPTLGGTKEFILGNYIANKGLQNDRMRDEILCQLSNQTWKNDNTANSQRGWLLMANCLSVFQPSSALYKYLLKYVSDHGINGYSTICQRKLLSSKGSSAESSRNFPPTELEWRSNLKRSPMVLSAEFPDGSMGSTEVNSWVTAEEFGASLLRGRGIDDVNGWTIDMTEDDSQQSIPHFDYVFDLLGSREVPPVFTTEFSSVITSGNRYMSMPNQTTNTNIFDGSPILSKRCRSPLQLTRKLSREALEAHDKTTRSSDGPDDMRVLSRTSILNNRYFDDKSKSRSLDNLLENPNLKDLGLSGSKLNERYHSIERLADNSTYPHGIDVPDIHKNDIMASGQQRGSLEAMLIESEMRDSLGKGLAGSKAWNKYNLAEDGMMVDDFPKSMASRYVKAGHMGKRAYSGCHSSRAQIERGEMKSSAMSDTSETPSLASHVRRVRVPSQASDVDQFLDDLFMPVLDNQLDELSDARSLVASIKGGNNSAAILTKIDDGVATTKFNFKNDLNRTEHDLNRNILENIYRDIEPLSDLWQLENSGKVAISLKGTGTGAAELDTNMSGNSALQRGLPLGAPSSTGAGTSPTPFSNLNTIPLYSSGGNMLPGAGGPGIPNNQVDPSQIAFYQQNLQRAYLQSAVAQNMQIQQHLIAQNQALHQLIQQQAIPDNIYGPNMGINLLGLSPMNGVLQNPIASSAIFSDMAFPKESQMTRDTTPILPRMQLNGVHNKVSFQEPDQGELWSNDKARGASSASREAGRNGQPVSPPPPLLPLGTPMPSSSLAFHQAVASSSPLPEQSKRKSSGDKRKNSYEASSSRHPESPLGGMLRPPGPQDMYSSDGYMGNIPIPPPLPTHLQQIDPMGGFMDPYQRAKTVRIGKWRWPPPKEEVDGSGDSFMQFKLRQQSGKRNSKEKDTSRSNSKDGSAEIEWEEFEFAENGGEMHSTPKYNHRHSKGMNGNGHVEFMQNADKYPASPYPNDDEEFESWDQLEAKEEKELKKMRHQQEKRMSSKEKERKDSWDSAEEDDKSAGIGKLKISREMKEKLEALTASHPNESKSGGKKMKDKSGRKLEEHRRLLLQRQLAGDRWDSVHAVTDITDNRAKHNLSNAPPQPILPGMKSSQFRPSSPSLSLSSQESSPVIPKTKSPPTSIKPNTAEIMYRDDRLHSQRVDQFEFDESPEFLQPVDRVPRIKDEEKEKKNIEGIRTKILNPPQGAALTYTKVPWKLTLRKEIFTPNETLSGDALHLVFCQVVQDAFGPNNPRISKDNRQKLLMAMNSSGVTLDNILSANHKVAVKKEVVETAKDFPLYFSVIIPIMNNRKENDAEFLAISHSGVRFLKMEENSLEILNEFSLKEIEQASCTRKCALRLIFTNELSNVTIIPRAQQAALLINKLLSFENGRNVFVRALADYMTRETTLLTFRKGDIISVSNLDDSKDKGWLHGQLDGRDGMFPVEYVTPIKYSAGISEARMAGSKGRAIEGSSHVKHKTKNELEQSALARREGESTLEWNMSRGSVLHQDDSGNSSIGDTAPIGSDEGSPKPTLDDGKHSLFQFALEYFRGAKENGVSNGSLPSTAQKNKKKKGSKDSSEWTWKQLVELVKFSQSPLKDSLLPLEGELGQLALETFISIMRYMGDFPMDVQQTEVHCVYSILMNCHKHEALRDEVYCQIMKQTTNNKSSVPESCQRGWRLFSVIAAYFTCSAVLKPYLLKYLETNAYDKRRAFHGTAMVCLQNVRKTFKYGGRKNVPSIEEITAITAGRSSKRQIYRLPGGTERVINTKSTSVVQDIIEELCVMINVRSPMEQEEFSLYCIVEGDSFTMPLAREEYVLDVTTELLKNKQVFYLIFCRSVYYHSLRLDNSLYIEVVFNQIAPDYLAGLLLVTPGEHLEQETVYDIAKIAALMHRAADLETVPTIKEVRFLLPKPILTAREVKPTQWLNLVQGSWSEVSTLSNMEAKAAVLEILQNWSLFGSAFFAVERSTEPEEFVQNILALNRHGVHFLDDVTHETLINYTLDKILSTRKVKGNDGQLYLDMKCGNLLKPRILTVRTAQAHEISRQIRQYITIEQRVTERNKGDIPKDMTLSR